MDEKAGQTKSRGREIGKTAELPSFLYFAKGRWKVEIVIVNSNFPRAYRARESELGFKLSTK